MSAPPSPEPDAVPPADTQPAYGVPSPSLLERADAGLDRFLADSPDLDPDTRPTAAP